MRVVEAYGIRYLSEPKELKYWLCPVIAENEIEQKLFYQVFDKYLNDAVQLPEPIVELPWWQTLPKWMVALLLSLLLLSIGEGLRRFFSNPTTDDTIQYTIDYTLEKEAVTLGDTIKGINQSRDLRDTFQLDFRWEILDAASGKIEWVEEKNTDLNFIAKTFGSSPRKQIRLIGIDKATGKRDTATTRDLTLLCNAPPLVDTIAAPIQINHETKLDFEAKPLDNRDYKYRWQFGDEQKEGKRVNHRFKKMGAVNVTLKATIAAEGVCETRVTKNISIGSLKPPLALKKLERDQMLPIAVIGEGMWLLIGLLSFLACWFWYKIMSKEPERLQVIDEEKRLARKFKTSNNSPYFIPFRPKSKLIRPESSLYLFAKVLRQRQEGTRQNMDIPATLQTTIAKGGFPNIQTKLNQQPADYIFLIDEQAEVSIQAKLFDTLVNFIAENDVHVERFWYKNEYYRFWNDQYPEGIDLEILHRKYGHCRLVIMGNGHELISERMASGLQIAPNLLKTFGKWKSRQLFTPLPAVSWSFQEIVLYRLFQVYPANTQGIEAALSYDFREREEGLEASFDDWQEQLLTIEKHPDVKHRKWSRLKGYQDYLKDYPTLFTWLCGLAVYENPTWETTIAIGKALESKGVEVTHDHLLILSHLPFLQGETFKPTLRKTLMNQLDTETLALARGAIKEELEAVLESVKNSHANREVQTTLAIQNFALQPENKGYKAEVRYLLEGEIFRRNQVEELDWEAEKLPKEVSGVKQEENAQYEGIEDYLSESYSKNSNDLWNLYRDVSIVIIILFLALFSFFSNETGELYELAFGMTREEGAKTSDEGLKHYFLVKEEIQIDTALIYNNMAVDRWEKYLKGGLMKEIEEKELFIFDSLKRELPNQIIFPDSSYFKAIKKNELLQRFYLKRDSIAQFFQLSLRRNPAYRLARLNLDKLTFNLATEQYQKYRANNIHAILLSAWGKFPTGSESIALDALHGDGIVNFYVFPTILDSALLRYDKIMELNPTYFDTLQSSSNLRDLLSPILNFQVYSGLIMDKTNSKRLEKVRISSNYFDVLSDGQGFYEFTFSDTVLNEGILIQYSKNGYQSQSTKIRLADVSLIMPEVKLTKIDIEEAPKCVDAMSLTIGNDGTVAVLASMFAEFRSDNFTATEDLQFSFTPSPMDSMLVFDCDDSGSTIFVTVWATDEAGNKSNCSGSITINGNVPECLTGKTNTEEDSIQDVTTATYGEIGTFTDARDKQSYRWVRLKDGKKWMAENLNYITPDSWCYDTLDINCDKYGRLYTWDAAKTACPKGWHLPSDAEWWEMASQYGKAYNARDGQEKNNSGSAGKEAYKLLMPDGSSGFSALLGGDRYSDGSFHYVGDYGAYWSSTEKGSSNAWNYYYDRQLSDLGRNNGGKSLGFSCRCIQD